MLDTIGAFGSGIGTNLLSDSLSKKLEAFKDKKAIASFTQSLRDWEIEFEKQNDGTIITNGAFYSHVKYHNVIENIVAYVLEPSMNAVTEDESRVLICIDALNEGAGVTFWNSVLGGLVDFLKEFPHIGLLVSVRTQYEDSLFDGQDTLRAQMQRIEHFGLKKLTTHTFLKEYMLSHLAVW